MNTHRAAALCDLTFLSEGAARTSQSLIPDGEASVRIVSEAEFTLMRPFAQPDVTEPSVPTRQARTHFYSQEGLVAVAKVTWNGPSEDAGLHAATRRLSQDQRVLKKQRVVPRFRENPHSWCHTSAPALFRKAATAWSYFSMTCSTRNRRSTLCQHRFPRHSLRPSPGRTAQPRQRTPAIEILGCSLYLGRICRIHWSPLRQTCPAVRMSLSSWTTTVIRVAFASRLSILRVSVLAQRSHKRLGQPRFRLTAAVKRADWYRGLRGQSERELHEAFPASNNL